MIKPILRLMAFILPSKVCYSCGWCLPLFMFLKTSNKHLLANPTTKGRCYSCNLCKKPLPPEKKKASTLSQRKGSPLIKPKN